LDVAYFALSRDDRDKVYGLVGMMDKAIAKQLAPDYSIETRSVFTAVARAFILTYDNLDLLFRWQSLERD